MLHQSPIIFRLNRCAFIGHLLITLLLAASANAEIRAESFNEYEVKAAFLYNFAKFVEWPQEAFKNADDPIAICILGENPFGRALDSVVSGKTVAGRSLSVNVISDVQQAAHCQVLFVSASERKRKRSIFDSLSGSEILVVGEMDGFANDGGVINFILQDGRVRFEINSDAAVQRHLKVSAKLMALGVAPKK